MLTFKVGQKVRIIRAKPNPEATHYHPLGEVVTVERYDRHLGLVTVGRVVRGGVEEIGAQHLDAADIEAIPEKPEVPNFVQEALLQAYEATGNAFEHGVLDRFAERLGLRVVTTTTVTHSLEPLA